MKNAFAIRITPKVKNNRFQAMIKFLSRTGQKFNHRLKAVVFNFWRKACQDLD